MRLLREPLLHFLLIGAALFAIYTAMNPASSKVAAKDTVVVSSGRIEQLASIFMKTWQRPPTREELEGLVDDFVLEEVYYRKAIEMGIDRDDTMIRRRLRQKLEFVTDDTVALAGPGDADLEGYLHDHAETFRTSPTFTFRQIYFNPEKLGDDALDVIRAKADELRAGGEVTGDATLLPEGLEMASTQAIDGTFGSGFATNLIGLPVGEWSDPIPSSFGLHLVRVDASVPGELPPLEKIRPTVEREWANDQRVEARAAFNAALLEGVEIVVDWPGSEEGDISETKPDSEK